MDNRVIKFRVWCIKSKKFIEEPTRYERLAIGCNGGVYSGKYDDIVDGYFVQQYTGLKDTNGKEIYEGDIIKFHKWNYPQKNKEDYLCRDNKKVVWGLDYGQYPYAGWTVISLKPTDLEDGYPLNHMDQRNMEVIGNIYENPELIKS